MRRTSFYLFNFYLNGFLFQFINSSWCFWLHSAFSSSVISRRTRHGFPPQSHYLNVFFVTYSARPDDRIIANRLPGFTVTFGPEPYAIANRNRLAKFWTRIARFGIGWMSWRHKRYVTEHAVSPIVIGATSSNDSQIRIEAFANRCMNSVVPHRQVAPCKIFSPVFPNNCFNNARLPSKSSKSKRLYCCASFSPLIDKSS